jgi:hypothetical protein
MFESKVNRGKANGYVPLEANSKISSSYIDAASLGVATFPYTGSVGISGSITVNGPSTISGNYFNIGLSPALLGPKVYFERLNYTASIDIISSGSLEIAREDNQGGIYNYALEANFNSNLSPSGTLWNSIYTDEANYGWHDLQSLPYRTYDTFREALNNNIGKNILYTPLVMHDTVEDTYYLIQFSKWTAGGNGGGFAYDRYEVIFPSSVYFTKPNYSSSIVDPVSPSLVIKRDNQQGIYNSVLEQQYDNNAYLSPLGTRWNSIYTDPANYGFSNLSNVKGRTYNSWYEALDESVGNNIVGLEMIMHDIQEDQYYKVKFDSWTQNAGGGGFSYTRSIILPEGAVFFPDGTTQTTAKESSIKTIGSTLYSTNPGTSNFSLDNSVFLGYQAGYSASSADFSNFLGFQAGYLAQNANSSNFFGNGAGDRATNADYSNFIGYAAGQLSVNSNESNFLGYAAGQNSPHSNRSNFLGSICGESAHSASNSNFMGFESGRGATYASHSNFFGYQSGYIASQAAHCTLIGYRAGYLQNQSIGSNNIIIGTNIALPADTKDSINLGGVIFATGSYSTTSGFPLTGPAGNAKVGINKSNPTQALDVSGSVQISQVLVLPPQDPLPIGVPTGSFAVSGSEVDCKPYFWNGSTWTPLF